MSSFLAAVYDRRVAVALRATVSSSGGPATTGEPVLSGWPKATGGRQKICLLSLLGIALTACSSAVTPDKIAQIKPGMSSDQVQTLLGRPTNIEQSESSDQTISGEVDHYLAPSGEGRVIFINHAVFKAEFISGTQS